MQKSWKNLIDNNRFEQQTFPISAMFACSRYEGTYLSYDFTIFANFASNEHIFTCRTTLRQLVFEVSVLASGNRFCFSFAFRIISTSLHEQYKTSEDQGQLKRKSVNSN